MKTGTINVSELPLPAEDGALARALANLDAKLHAWRSLIAAAQVRFRAPGAAAESASYPGPTGAAACAVLDAPAPVRPEDRSETVSRTVVTCGHSIDEEEILAGLDPDMAAAIRAQRRAGRSKKTLGELIVEYESRQAEDELLLRTLDPQMAGAIRVQRRLCAYRKSVRELIAEYKPESKPEPRPKSWWDKVKEGARHGR